MPSLLEILPFLLPIIAIELGMRIYVTVDMFKEEREVILLSKTGWAVIVWVINFGWVFYLLGGRKQ
jgi:hypothetical protein